MKGILMNINFHRKRWQNGCNAVWSEDRHLSELIVFDFEQRWSIMRLVKYKIQKIVS